MFASARGGRNGSQHGQRDTRFQRVFALRSRAHPFPSSPHVSEPGLLQEDIAFVCHIHRDHHPPSLFARNVPGATLHMVDS